MVRIVPLGSGSSGNATLVSFGTRHLLIDAGLAARDLALRLAAVGVVPERVTAILMSHEHHDHARGVERFSVRHRVPVLSTPETLAALNLAPRHLAAWHPFDPGTAFEIEEVRVDPFAVPHDAENPVGFVLEGSGVRVGVATDLGHATTLVIERLTGCHALLVEANHDDDLLARGPYPWALKQRIGGRLGHLSNNEAARLLSLVAGDDCSAVILAHLSEKNNAPALARARVASELARAGRRRYEMRVADRRKPTAEVVL